MHTLANLVSDAVVEAPHDAERYWPAMEAATGSVLLIGADLLDSAEQRFEVWRSYVGADRASVVFDWMSRQRDAWPLWGRVAVLFGESALRPIIVERAEMEAEQDARDAEKARLEEVARSQLRGQVDLFVLDARGQRPGLSLRSGDESKSFFVMRFSEKWERERVLDWLRWQKDRFVALRDLHHNEGDVALERLIIAGMRQTEAEVKARGMSSGGRRPLRFWRGET